MRQSIDHKHNVICTSYMIYSMNLQFPNTSIIFINQSLSNIVIQIQQPLHDNFYQSV